MGRDCAWVALSLVPGLGGRIAKQLLEEFGSPLRVLRASREDLEAIHGVGPKLAAAIRRGPERDRLQDELLSVRRAGAKVVGLGQTAYPPLLREIPDPPLVLYVLGRPPERSKPRVAIVGTRRPTDTGVRIARDLARDLARAGVEVVSGMARGIDCAAHAGALEGGGTTLAVLGCGVDVLYPMARRDLRERIAAMGTLVSEFPMRTTPLPEYFPRRNRIISGLSSAVVVVEAGARSGALLTADLALEQGREVMAVPGSPRSRASDGPNRLLQEGAKIVLSMEDIIEELPIPMPEEGDLRAQPDPLPGPEGEGEREILRALESGSCFVDDIAASTGLGPAILLEKLLGMELRGLVRRTGGARYEQVER